MGKARFTPEELKLRIKERDRRRNMLPARVAARKAYIATTKGKQVRRETMKRYYRDNPGKRKATIALNNALRDGRVTKSPCEMCAATKVEAHHEDYSKPLEVRWLCNKHHREQHKKAA